MRCCCRYDGLWAKPKEAIVKEGHFNGHNCVLFRNFGLVSAASVFLNRLCHLFLRSFYLLNEGDIEVHT
jgi:hypothetical protein